MTRTRLVEIQRLPGVSLLTTKKEEMSIVTVNRAKFNQGDRVVELVVTIFEGDVEKLDSVVVNTIGVIDTDDVYERTVVTTNEWTRCPIIPNRC